MTLAFHVMQLRQDDRDWPFSNTRNRNKLMLHLLRLSIEHAEVQRALILS